MVTGFAPATASGLNKILAKLNNNQYISEVFDESDITEGLRYKVVLKRTVPKDVVEERLYDVLSMFEASQGIVFSVTERSVSEEGQADAKFSYISMPDFFGKWSQWRIELERRAISYSMSVEEVKLAKDRLLLLAVQNRKKIIEALDSDNPLGTLMTLLKISQKDANTILDLRIRQLKKLEEKNIKARIAKALATLEKLNIELDDPTERIFSVMDSL